MMLTCRRASNCACSCCMTGDALYVLGNWMEDGNWIISSLWPWAASTEKKICGRYVQNAIEGKPRPTPPPSLQAIVADYRTPASSGDGD